MYFIIGADIVPTESNMALFEAGDARKLVGDRLLEILSGAVHCIFNLEVPLTDECHPILKQGPNLLAPVETVNGYKNLGIDFFTLANNHIMDQGVQGLNTTLHVLDKAGIKYFGAGNDVNGASLPITFNFGNKAVGLYGCAEHEFSIAGKARPGANPYDPLWSFDHVSDMKQNGCDYIVVLYHGGKEEYRYPSPLLQKVCRKFVDKGASLVVCQHTHCIGCCEEYNGGTIVYGQGNFIFDYNNNEFWNTSLLISVSEDLSIDYIPIVKKGNVVKKANELEAKDILRGFYRRSKEIMESNAIENNYKELASIYKYNYLRAFIGKAPFWVRVINTLSGRRFMNKYIENKYGERQKILLWNYLDCETHRELALAGIRSFYGGYKKD